MRSFPQSRLHATPMLWTMGIRRTSYGGPVAGLRTLAVDRRQTRTRETAMNRIHRYLADVADLVRPAVSCPFVDMGRGMLDVSVPAIARVVREGVIICQ